MTCGWQKLIKNHFQKIIYLLRPLFETECFRKDLKIRLDFSLKIYFAHFNEKGY